MNHVNKKDMQTLCDRQLQLYHDFGSWTEVQGVIYDKDREQICAVYYDGGTRLISVLNGSNKSVFKAMPEYL